MMKSKIWLYIYMANVFTFYFQVYFFLLLLSQASSYPEIWPPNGHLTPNNYLPPPKCRYEQETVYEDVLEEICKTKTKDECKTEVISTEEKRLERMKSVPEVTQ